MNISKKTLNIYVKWLCAILLIDVLFFMLVLHNEDIRVQYSMPDCASHIRQIAYACASYADVYGYLPACTVDADNKALHSWRVLILPFVEQKELYQHIRLNEPWNSEYNKQFHNVMISEYICPKQARKILGTTAASYFLITGKGSVFDENNKMSIDKFYQDGTVPFMIEVQKNISWMCPIDVSFDEYDSPGFLSSIEFHCSIVYPDLHPKTIRHETYYQIVGAWRYYIEKFLLILFFLMSLITIIVGGKVVLLFYKIRQSRKIIK
jgi:hypothetical protein